MYPVGMKRLLCDLCSMRPCGKQQLKHGSSDILKRKTAILELSNTVEFLKDLILSKAELRYGI